MGLLGKEYDYLKLSQMRWQNRKNFQFSKLKIRYILSFCRYNIELCQHAKSTGHEVNFTATDEYQKRIRCQLCDVVFRSLVALQRHQLTFHKSECSTNSESSFVPYYCSFCSLSFKTTEEAVMHRRTLTHKEIVKSTKADNPSVSRECLNCNKHLSSLSELRTHLLEVHPELCFRYVKYYYYSLEECNECRMN